MDEQTIREYQLKTRASELCAKYGHVTGNGDLPVWEALEARDKALDRLEAENKSLSENADAMKRVVGAVILCEDAIRDHIHGPLGDELVRALVELRELGKRKRMYVSID